MRELSLEEIHLQTLELMDTVHKICEENKIQYYLCYGTLIGAIRHNGFIPWDDDFDIMMKRDDYERFCDIMGKYKYDHIRLFNRANTKNYLYGITRIVDTRFKYTSEIATTEQIDMGIFIDIYPLDNCGNTSEEAKALKRKCNQWNFRYAVYLDPKGTQGGIRRILRYMLHYLYRVRYGRSFGMSVDRKIFNIIQQNTGGKDKYISLICWEKATYPYDRRWFDDPVLHSFEGRQYWIPKDYDQILDMVYTNYREMPPEDKRVPSHFYTIYEA